MLVGDTGDKTNSIITLCSAHLLQKAQRDLYILTLNRVSSKTKIKRLQIKCPSLEPSGRQPSGTRALCTGLFSRKCLLLQNGGFGTRSILDRGGRWRGDFAYMGSFHEDGMDFGLFLWLLRK